MRRPLKVSTTTKGSFKFFIFAFALVVLVGIACVSSKTGYTWRHAFVQFQPNDLTSLQTHHVQSVNVTLPPTNSSLCARLTPSQRRLRLQSPAINDPHFVDKNDYVEYLTNNSNRFVYFPKPNIFLYITLKAGSRALLDWLFRGITGAQSWHDIGCKSYVQDVRAKCWQQHAFFLSDLDLNTRWNVLTDDHVMRITIQRDPYQRLLSAFKSKYTCQTEKFNSDMEVDFKTQLRQQANMSNANVQSCMNISEFADVIDRIRTNGGKDGVVLARYIESHVRPQDVHADVIDYDVILDSKYLAFSEHLALLYDRLPYKENVPPFVAVEHTSGNASLFIPSAADEKLKLFANLSRIYPLKNCPRRPAQK